ncbi:MAG: CDP-alcohol phosphatidyltransferase family protein [Rhodospirillales bacterium]
MLDQPDDAGHLLPVQVSHGANRRGRARAVIGKLPLIRMMSRAVAPGLASLGMTPNQVTALGMVAGLVAAACFAFGSPLVQVLGAAMFALSTLLDYCDGELARMRGMGSRFGAYFDDFVDWIVHAALFLAIGYHAMNDGGHVVWMWLGVAAALGGTINAILPLILGGVPDGEGQISTLSDLGADAGWIDVAIFAFRGLARADFWLIVFGLALGGWLWVLLPAAAIGAQVFWLLYLKKSVRRILT